MYILLNGNTKSGINFDLSRQNKVSDGEKIKMAVEEKFLKKSSFREKC